MKIDYDKKRHTRDAYGKTLVELGEEHPDMAVLDADLSCSTKTYLFGEKYPERFFNVGVQEQNLMGMAAGLALEDRLVYASCFAMFGAGRAWEQIRNSISYDKLNVKIVLTHAGITVGKDGSSHQIIEDIALLRSIPGMKVMIPCDYESTRAMIRHVASEKGPCYIRLSREKSVDVYPEGFEFDFTTPNVLREGADVAILTCGYLVADTLKAAELLESEGVSARVVDVQSIKPLNREFIVKTAKETGALVTVEEHCVFGGLGGAVSEVLAENYPAPVRFVGVRDRFGVSGSAKELLKEYGLTSEDIVEQAKKAVSMKK